MSSKASSEPVDLEKGVTGLKKEEEELSAVDLPKSMRITFFLMDATALLYVLLFVGYMAWAIMASNTWWDPLLALGISLPVLVLTLWLTIKVKEVCIQRHAMEEEGTLGNDDSDLSTKLLAASSN